MDVPIVTVSVTPLIVRIEEMLELPDDQRREFWWRCLNDPLFNRVCGLAVALLEKGGK